MSGKVQILGIGVLRGRMQRWPSQISAAVRDQITKEVSTLIDDMRARANAVGGSARLASSTLRIESTKDGMSVIAGGTSGRESLVLKGAEFGGGKRPKRAYVTLSRRGRPYIVRRRTTRQFRPFLGSHGYWYWPTAKKDLKGINARVGAIIRGAVS